MGSIALREIREGEVPIDGGTALQEDPDRPAFSGNGPNDYVCVQCGKPARAGDAAGGHDQEGARAVWRVLDGECGGD